MTASQNAHFPTPMTLPCLLLAQSSVQGMASLRDIVAYVRANCLAEGFFPLLFPVAQWLLSTLERLMHRTCCQCFVLQVVQIDR